MEVKNKKGNTPLWLACNGGHLDVVMLLVGKGADVNAADNRGVTPLMAAFRKGHVQVRCRIELAEVLVHFSIAISSAGWVS